MARHYLHWARLAASQAREKSALDVMILDLRKLSTMADFFVICSGRNIRQTQAIASHIEIVLAARGLSPRRTAGHSPGNWILIDYGALIIHVMTEELRAYYDLEGFWGRAERIEVA